MYYNDLESDVFKRIKKFYQTDLNLFGYDATMKDNKVTLECKIYDLITNETCC